MRFYVNTISEFVQISRDFLVVILFFGAFEEIRTVLLWAAFLRILRMTFDYVSYITWSGRKGSLLFTLLSSLKLLVWSCSVDSRSALAFDTFSFGGSLDLHLSHHPHELSTLCNRKVILLHILIWLCGESFRPATYVQSSALMHQDTDELSQHPIPSSAVPSLHTIKL